MMVCISVNDVVVTISTDYKPDPFANSQESYKARLAIFDKLFETAKELINRKIFGNKGGAA